jgi:ribosomal protein S18 acetylase RimI-like enzyme
MSPIEIVELTPADAAAFRDLRLRGLREHPEAFGEAAEDLEQRPLDAVAARIESTRADGGFILAAKSNGRFIGLVGVRPEMGRKNWHRAFLWGMYVPREHQGKGIGRKLIETALARCRANPAIEYVRLSVITNNSAAIDLYRSLGFEQYGCEPRSLKVNGEYYDEYLMIISTSGQLQSRSDDRK